MCSAIRVLRICCRCSGVGFCGAYTTFSTMQIEILQMIDRNRLELAGGYALTSVVCGYLAISFATRLIRRGGASA